MKTLPHAATCLGVVIALIVTVGCDRRPPPPPDLEGMTDNPDAMAMMSQLLEDTRRFPDNSLARRRLCLALEANGFDAHAADCYEGLLHFYEDDDEMSKRASALVRLAATLSRTGEATLAIEALEQATALAPDHAPIHWRKGDLLAEAGNTEAAEAAYLEAIEADPADPGGHWGFARVLLQRGDFDAAAAHLDESAVSNQRYTQYLLGRALRGAGRMDEAERAFAIAGDSEPFVADPWDEEVRAFSLAVGTRIDHALDLSDKGQHRQARAMLEAMRTGGEAEVALLNALGRVAVNAGDTSEASGFFLEALRLQPASTETLLNLAAARLTAGNHLEAARHAGTVLDTDPGNLRALEIRGHALMQLGHFDDARAAFGTAIDEGSPDAMLRIWNALMLCRERRCEAAAPLLDDAVSLFPRHVEVQARAVSLALAAGRRDVARRALANLEANAPNDPRLPGLREDVNAP